MGMTRLAARRYPKFTAELRQPRGKLSLRNCEHTFGSEHADCDLAAGIKTGCELATDGEGKTKLCEGEDADAKLADEDDTKAELGDGDDAAADLTDGDDAARGAEFSVFVAAEGDVDEGKASDGRLRFEFVAAAVPGMVGGVRSAAVDAGECGFTYGLKAVTAGDQVGNWSIAVMPSL